MTAEAHLPEITPIGEPAPLVRMFGWISLTTLVAFLINNILSVKFDYPGVLSVIGDGGSLAWIQVLIYVVGIAVAVAFVIRTPDRALRWDARRIGAFNIYLIRALFWGVLLVGITDAAISFMRVEKLLTIFFDDEGVRAFTRARFVGPYIHIPLIVAGFIIALFNRSLGFHWLALLIVAAELTIVMSRFIFSYEQALMGDLVRYWYAALFLFASAYTLLDEGHVRVDVLYAGFTSRRKGRVNAIGSILLGMTTSWVIIFIGLGSKQSIINSPIANFEITQTGGTGMFVKYQMAGFLAVFAITMLIQFVSYLFEAVADTRDEPGKREPTPIAH
ncbi:MAG: TRAP transporter small permease subunit [Pikeienuella sp.]